MDLPLTFFLVSALAVLITGLSKSAFGGGLGVLSVPMMSLFIAPQLAAAILMPILLAMDVLIAWHYRRSWDRRVVGKLLPGAILGLVLGALVFHRMDPDVIRLAVGLLALAFVAQFVLSGRGAGQGGRLGGSVVVGLGALSGFASFVAHAGGPPVKGVLLQQGLPKTVFVGTNTMFFFSMNAIKTVAYGAMGEMSAETLVISGVLSPVLFLGIGLGLWLHRIADPGLFRRIVYGFLFLAGCRLIWEGLTASVV